MKSPLNILHLEDNAQDALLIEETLRADGLEFNSTRVQTRADFISSLEAGDVDLVLSDFSLPSFDGGSAVRIVQERWPALPVILVSGTLGEDLAVDSVLSGATDYVLKDRLTRLAPAVRRAMLEVEERVSRAKLEERFIEAQKMEVVGQLSAGVAHDFNNILAVIMGYCDLISSELEPESTLRKFADEIQHASERAASLTRQLLVFSRKQSVQPVVLDLNRSLKEITPMLRRLIDENIVLEIANGEGLGCLKADPGYVGQVIMNLAVNARDAMPQGGTLKLTTRNVSISGDGAESGRKVPPGRYVVLAVQDSGTGMSDEVKARLFEAFFTTKPAGKGTGLGLATCQTIVQQSDGFIEIQSELGLGTTFEIYFPRVDEEVEASTHRLPAEPLARGYETLLVVEDEPSVRHLAASVLEGQGYTVLQACNGQDGLRVAGDHHGVPISLVVTDVIMPLMSGKIMAEWLEATYPNVKVLFTSGYTDDALAQHGVLEPGIALLQKPYSPATLLRLVREMLDK